MWTPAREPQARPAGGYGKNFPYRPMPHSGPEGEHRSTQPNPPTLWQPTWQGDLQEPAWSRREHARRPSRPGRWQRPSGARPHSRVGKVARGLTGSLAAGLLVLGLVLAGVQFWATQHDFQGPKIVPVTFQLIAAVGALSLQTVADRRADRAGAFSALGSFALVISSLWFWWWL